MPLAAKPPKAVLQPPRPACGPVHHVHAPDRIAGHQEPLADRAPLRSSLARVRIETMAIDPAQAAWIQYPARPAPRSGAALATGRRATRGRNPDAALSSNQLMILAFEYFRNV